MRSGGDGARPNGRSPQAEKRARVGPRDRAKSIRPRLPTQPVCSACVMEHFVGRRSHFGGPTEGWPRRKGVCAPTEGPVEGLGSANYGTCFPPKDLWHKLRPVWGFWFRSYRCSDSGTPPGAVPVPEGGSRSGRSGLPPLRARPWRLLFGQLRSGHRSPLQHAQRLPPGSVPPHQPAVWLLPGGALLLPSGLVPPSGGARGLPAEDRLAWSEGHMLRLCDGGVSREY